MKQKMSFTVIYVKDVATGKLTAYLPDFPHVIADGDTEAEALSNLRETMAMLNEARHEAEETAVYSETMTTGSLEMEFAA